MLEIRCPCGQDHSEHRAWTQVRRLIAQHGETLCVTVGGASWHVPRIWIAFHGLRADRLAALAEQYGWSRAG